MTRPITVLDLRDTDEIGGPGKTILETFRAIDRSRFQLHVAVFLTRGEATETPFVRAARDCGLPVHFIRGTTNTTSGLSLGLPRWSANSALTSCMRMK